MNYIIKDGYKMLDYNYPQATIDYTEKTCKVSIARYDYLLDSKDQKIEMALQQLKAYDTWLLQNRIEAENMAEYISELTKRYNKRANLYNAYKMHVRDRENLFYKYIIQDADALLEQIQVENIDIYMMICYHFN